MVDENHPDQSAISPNQEGGEHDLINIYNQKKNLKKNFVQNWKSLNFLKRIQFVKIFNILECTENYLFSDWWMKIYLTDAGDKIHDKERSPAKDKTAEYNPENPRGLVFRHSVGH